MSRMVNVEGFQTVLHVLETKLLVKYLRSRSSGTLSATRYSTVARSTLGAFVVLSPIK